MNELARKSERVIWAVQEATPKGWRNVYGELIETREEAREVAHDLRLTTGRKHRVARYEMKETA